MGGDGGSLPQRADMVRTKGYVSSQKSGQGSMGFHPNSFIRESAEVLDARTCRRLKMTTCALSNEPLGKHVVASRAGYLFNKETILRKLLELKSGEGVGLLEEFSNHIGGLKDLVTLNLVHACPITKKELVDGSSQVVAMAPCGCVLSQKAVDLAKTGGDVCLVCNAPTERVIKLTPNESEFEAQLEVAKSLKSASKKTKSKSNDDRPNLPKKRVLSDPLNESSSETFKKLFHA